ncbi:MAG TPA: cytochrome c [Solirubrobacterales bacterium]|jgi:mono/diheme cytochrome c family protein|nr:cytochrome c [Solirubrobacterales bacterium]
MKRPIVMFIVLAAICLVVLPFWALQTKGGADASPEASVPPTDQQGLQLFQINCGACHTLAAAGTDGVVGPNLDQLLATGAKTPDTVKGNYQRVVNAVEQGVGGRMPKGLVQGEQVRTVAQFVADNVAYVDSP